MTATPPNQVGRLWAYLGMILGVVVSVAANVAHSYVPPINAPDNWTPQIGAVWFSVFWPVALFISVEILMRIPWPAGWKHLLIRGFGMLPVVLVVGIVSYRHLSGLLTFYGEDSVVAMIGPAGVDGLMVLATAALMGTAPVQAVTRTVEHLTETATTEDHADWLSIFDLPTAEALTTEPTTDRPFEDAPTGQREVTTEAPGLPEPVAGRTMALQPVSMPDRVTVRVPTTRRPRADQRTDEQLVLEARDGLFSGQLSRVTVEEVRRFLRIGQVRAMTIRDLLVQQTQANVPV